MHANPCCFRFLLFFLFARSNRICHAAGCLLWGRPSDVSLFRPVYSGYITGDLHAVTLMRQVIRNAVGWIFQHREDHLQLIVQFAIENCHLYLIYPLKMVIFHSQVSICQLSRGYRMLLPDSSFPFPAVISSASCRMCLTLAACVAQRTFWMSLGDLGEVSALSAGMMRKDGKS